VKNASDDGSLSARPIDSPRTYAPRAFTEFDLARLDALFDNDPFVTLISIDGQGAPFIGHLPVLYARQGRSVKIEGHWARANQQARHRGPMSMIVHGPSAYVSPGWYPDKEEAARVPTWNYAVAHLQGEPMIYEDETALASLVDRLSRHYEARVGSDWRFEPEREDHRVQLRGITGFMFEPTRIDLKFKLSQNHPAANRDAVREAFARDGNPGAARLAAWMAERKSGEPGDFGGSSDA
jgi:transcriptional regulator